MIHYFSILSCEQPDFKKKNIFVPLWSSEVEGKERSTMVGKWNVFVNCGNHSHTNICGNFAHRKTNGS
jgi:hypothetical protein